MSTRFLGDSTLMVPPVIFGAWALGGWHWGGRNKSTDAQAIDAIHASIDNGFSCFDTAPVYGFGSSETILGKALSNRRDKVTILTKVGLRWDCTDGAHFFNTDSTAGPRAIYRNLKPNSIRHEVESSLRRLNTDYIDLLQCHWPDPSTPIEETMEAMKALLREGKIRAVGVSNFNIAQLEQCQQALSPFPLASHQPKYSLLDRQIEQQILPWTIDHNIGTIVYSPIEQGLLSGKVGMDRRFPDSDGRARHPLFQPERRRSILHAIEQLESLQQKYKCTPAQLAIVWVTHQPGITAAIVGARNPQQAIENAHASRISLSTEDITLLGDTFAQLSVSRSEK